MVITKEPSFLMVLLAFYIVCPDLKHFLPIFHSLCPFGRLGRLCRNGLKIRPGKPGAKLFRRKGSFNAAHTVPACVTALRAFASAEQALFALYHVCSAGFTAASHYSSSVAASSSSGITAGSSSSAVSSSGCSSAFSVS